MPEAAVADRQKDLDKILEETRKLQEFYDEKDPDTGNRRRWDPEDRQKFDRLCAEGAALAEDIESEQKFTSLQAQNARLREVPEPTLPSARSHHQEKLGEREVAGYISFGDMVLFSEAFQHYAQTEYAKGNHAVVQLPSTIVGKNCPRGPHSEPLVPLTRAQRKAYEKFLRGPEMKAVPSLGAGVLDPDRLDRIPQVTADERIRIRDVISTGQTGASSVEYVREESMTNAAAGVTEGELKPEESLAYTLQSAPVRTVASQMPVQNQQLEDWAQLRGLINGRMRYSNQRTEEEHILYGSGTPPEIEGILTITGTTDIAQNGRYSAATHTLIDVVRMGISDVFVAGYEANAVLLHPFDWEEIVLEKGTDDRYVWAVVTDNNGSRIWGVRAVEAVGAASRDTGERNILVGDWAMGAQLLDRMQFNIQVGLIDDQFIRNMRTILGESRIALPIYAPAAFAFFETVAGS
jgi:HK97 family phage major capsid protein